MEPVCAYCNIVLHLREGGKGWMENINPNCPKNPSGPQYGHFQDASRNDMLKEYCGSEYTKKDIIKEKNDSSSA